ncbi:MAG: hypothetical protein ACK52I_30735 [Pseudomonadota bacterium]
MQCCVRPGMRLRLASSPSARAPAVERVRRRVTRATLALGRA